MREEIYNTVQENPGVHFRELQREVDCSSSTLNYHLPKLDLEEREFHGYRRFYPEEVPEEMRKPLAAMNHGIRGKMIYRIDQGDDLSDLTEGLDVSKSTISTHLKVLRDDGIVSEETEGRRKKLYLSNTAKKALKRYASDVLDEASEGFIDMWD